jgi:hypothetical protein
MYPTNILLELFSDDALLGSKDKSRAICLEGCLVNH